MSSKDVIIHEMLSEAAAIQKATKHIKDDIERAVSFIYGCTGKLVTTGMGKSGLIARKISATFASTGTTSIYLHPAEGIHGDLGMLQGGDVVLALSYSGNTAEILSIVPYIKFLNCPLVTITGHMHSALAKNSDLVIDASVDKDIEPFGLVPTASTAVQLAIGDALAVAVLQKKGFTVADFALCHTGGTIGKKLLVKIADLMHIGKQNPVVCESATLQVAIAEMTDKKLGCVSVVDTENKLVGFLADGDLRRFLSKGFTSIEIPVTEVMTKNPKRMQPGTLAVEALNLMEQYNITMLPVVDDDDTIVGLLHMHDLIKAGVVS